MLLALVLLVGLSQRPLWCKACFGCGKNLSQIWQNLLLAVLGGTNLSKTDFAVLLLAVLLLAVWGVKTDLSKMDLAVLLLAVFEG